MTTANAALRSEQVTHMPSPTNCLARADSERLFFA